jgi:hypothetical protein
MSDMNSKYSPISPIWALFAFLGSIIGAAFAFFMATGNLVADEISYADLAAIMLGAVTLILTVLGLAVAIAAIYGYREFMKRTRTVAAEKAEEVAVSAAVLHVQKHIETSLEAGLEEFVTERVRTIATQLLTPENLRQLIIEQIGAITYGDLRDDRLDASSVPDEPDDLDQLDEAEALAEEADDEGAVENTSEGDPR